MLSERMYKTGSKESFNTSPINRGVMWITGYRFIKKYRGTRNEKISFVIYALNNGGAQRSLVNLLTEIDFTNRAGRTGRLGIFSKEKRDSAEKASYNIV